MIIRFLLLAKFFIPGRLDRVTVTVRGKDLELVWHALAYEVTGEGRSDPRRVAGPYAERSSRRCPQALAAGEAVGGGVHGRFSGPQAEWPGRGRRGTAVAEAGDADR